MKVLVVGAGPVGLWLAGHLALGGGEVALVARGERGRALAAEGLTLHRPGSSFLVRPALLPDLAAARGGDFDWALVAVKSYDTAAVAQALAAAGAPPRLASFQNGVGNEATLAAALPGSTICAATLTTGLALASPVRVIGGAGGGIGLDAWPGADPLAAALAGGPVPLAVRRYPLPAAMKWSKLLLNLLGGASAALLGWPPARVFRDRAVFGLELAAWREALSTMRALGLAPVPLPGYPLPGYALAASALPEPLLYRLLAERLAAGRGERVPGLAADLAAGRPESEVTVLHGAVARAATAQGLATPVCAGLCRLLTDAAAGRLARDTFHDRPEALRAAVLGAGS